MIAQLVQILHAFMKPERPLPYLENPTNEACNQPVESLQVDIPHSNILLRSTTRSPDKSPRIYSDYDSIRNWLHITIFDNVILRYSSRNLLSKRTLDLRPYLYELYQNSSTEVCFRDE